jgi:hypothetical protein
VFELCRVIASLEVDGALNASKGALCSVVDEINLL